MNPEVVRAGMIARLREDLVGPHQHDEVFQGVRIRPSDVYLTGILWTSNDRMGGEEDDGQETNDEDDDSSSAVTPVGQQRPCSMGLSFCLDKESSGSGSLDVSIAFATYDFEQLEPIGGKGLQLKWTRREHRITLNSFDTHESEGREIPLKLDGLNATVSLHVRSRLATVGRMVTLTLINRSTPPVGDRNTAEAMMLFQCSMEVKSIGNTKLIPRPPRPAANDEDEQIGRLLYRNSPEFATGHQCSASWESTGGIASVIKTDWIPETSVVAFREDGSDVFKPLVENAAFDAAQLSKMSNESLLERLMQLPVAYEEWIGQRNKEMGSLNDELRPIAKHNLATCTQICTRIIEGVKAMRRDPRLLEAFKLANASMAIQHSWKPTGKASPLKWRPFQLGFILLAAPSVCNAESPDREVLDLLWFPTGGGKT